MYVDFYGIYMKKLSLSLVEKKRERKNENKKKTY